jgi:hypothetical protein
MTIPASAFTGPYKDEKTNFIYNLLFCDEPDMFRFNLPDPYPYPYNILFSEEDVTAELQKIIDDTTADPRIKLLVYRKQQAAGHAPAKKELLAVIVEVSLEEGPDVLASFSNGTARYINHSEKVVVWESVSDATVNELTAQLFDQSRKIVDQIGPWEEARRPFPPMGNTRITFLVSDGLYFGEAPTGVLFGDPLASEALGTATQLLQYLTEKTQSENK